MLIKLKVHAEAGRRVIVKNKLDAYEVWVKSPAREGRANMEALALLAAEMGCRPAQLHIVKGAQMPNKIIKLLGHS